MPLFRKSRSGTPAAGDAPVVPPVDLDVPVTNPALIEAIGAFAAAPSPKLERLMHQAFNRAVFLAAADFSDATITPSSSGAPGQSTIEAGSRLALATVTFEDAPLLAVFTDWDAIRKWTDQPVQGLVMPAPDVVSLGLSSYAGVVLNPGGPYLGLDHDRLRVIRSAGAGRA